MNFYLDCEFDGPDGQLISLALVCEDAAEFYWAIGDDEGWVSDPWVKQNVMPILRTPGATPTIVNGLPMALEQFLRRADRAHIIADWPDDVSYFCKVMITGPGQRISTPPLTFEVLRVDAYPTKLPNAVQHNALWDARALRFALQSRFW